MSPVPFGPLRYLYIGTSDIVRDLRYYTETLKAEKLWDHTGFGARVAALRLGGGPLLLLADHRPAPSCMPIYEVKDLKAAAAELKRRGWKPEGRSFEIPNGPCYRFDDPSGNPFAIFEDIRPEVLGAEPPPQ